MAKVIGNIVQQGVKGLITQQGVRGSIVESGAYDWAAWWASRTPSDIVLTPISDTEIQVDWTDGAEAADGIRIYVDGVLDGTADYGDGTYTIDGLTADTEYEITVVAYSGDSESPEISDDATTWTSEYDTVYDSWTNKPSDADSIKYNTWVKTKITDGTWATRDVLYNFAIHTNDAGEALKNWKNPGTHDATLVNAPAFVAYEGFTGDGATSYINTNYKPSTDAVNYAQDSASFGIYFRTSTDAAAYELHGAWHTGGLIRRIQISRPNNAANSYSVGLNSGTESTASTDKISGMYIGSRTASNIQKLYVNKNVVVNGIAASIAGLIDNNIFILALCKDTGAAGYFENDQVSCAFLGGGYTSDNVDDMTDDFEIYMDSQGTGIIT